MVKVRYNDRYLQRKFYKWATIELKMWLEELEQKIKDKTIEPNEIQWVGPVRQELERRARGN